MTSAALASINKVVSSAISDAVYESKHQSIDEIMSFLSEKIVLDDDMQAYFKEFKSKITHDMSKSITKRSRDPSAYNMWIKAKMAEIKQQNPNIKGKVLMLCAITEWKKHTGEPKSTMEKATHKKNSEP